MNNHVNQVLSAYENFLQSPIPVNLICINGSAGSQLVHSLLDSHEEVLTIPTIFSIYFDWKLELEKYAANPQKLVSRFFEISAFRFQYNGNMGRWADKSNPQIESEIKNLSELLQQVFEFKVKTSPITVKDFFILIHYSYAALKKIDLSKIKLIVNHHHHGPFAESSYRFYTAHTGFFAGTDNYECDANNSWMKWVKSDFPKITFTYVIRHPYDLYCSTLNYKHRADGNIMKLCHYFYLILYLEYLSWCFYIEHFKKFPQEIIFLKLEELHLKPTEVIPKYAQFLGISNSETLYESTYSGEKWFGSNPLRPVNGFNPKMADPQWPKSLSESHQQKVKFMYFEICKFFNYNPDIPNLKSTSIAFALIDELKYAINFLSKDVFFIGSSLSTEDHIKRIKWVFFGLFNKNRNVRNELVREIAYCKFLITYLFRRSKFFGYVKKMNRQFQIMNASKNSKVKIGNLANEL